MKRMSNEEMLAIAAEMEVNECDGCNFKNPVGGLQPYQFHIERHDWCRQFMMLCKICQSTCSGNATEYPQQYPQRPVLSTICYIGNLLRKDIRSITPLTTRGPA